MFRFPLGLKTEPAFLCLPGYRGGCLDRRFIGEIGALSRFCSLPGSLVISGAGCSASFPTGRAAFQREQGLKQALTVFPPPFFLTEDRATQSLLNKLIRSNLVDTTNQVEVLQRDPTSPLYSVKSFEELRL